MQVEAELAINAILNKKKEYVPPPPPEYDESKYISAITKEVRNFLISGRMVKLYKSRGSPKDMHLLASQDLKEIMAKKPNKSEVKKHWRMALHLVKTVETDFKDKKVYSRTNFAKCSSIFRKSSYPS